MSCHLTSGLLGLVGLLAAATALAQTDEIQVYDASIAEPDHVVLGGLRELHWP